VLEHIQFVYGQNLIHTEGYIGEEERLYRKDSRNIYRIVYCIRVSGRLGVSCSRCILHIPCNFSYQCILCTQYILYWARKHFGAVARRGRSNSARRCAKHAGIKKRHVRQLTPGEDRIKPFIEKNCLVPCIRTHVNMMRLRNNKSSVHFSHGGGDRKRAASGVGMKEG
jgi:hypothetical protein